MTFTLLFVFGCSLTVWVICTVLVFHPAYEDGLFGRLALAAVAIAAAARCFHLIDSGMTEEVRRQDVSNIAVILWAGLALFLARHLYRFYRWKNTGKGEWRNADLHLTGGKSFHE